MKLPIILAFFMLLGCHRLPSRKLTQWNQKIHYAFQQDSLIIKVNNPLACPLQIQAESGDRSVQAVLDNHFSLLLDPGADTVLAINTGTVQGEPPIRFNAALGNPEGEVSLQALALPFPKNRTYAIIQGYNGQFSHNHDYSRFALDFDLAEGDTICSAADGFVVGVIDDYRYGGNTEKWRDYANYITLFHPAMNCFTQYVHLKHKGSLVMVGDHIQAGQPIGLSGKTGFATTEHLHFNVLIAGKNDLESVPATFQGGYRGVDLKRGDRVIHR